MRYLSLSTTCIYSAIVFFCWVAITPCFANAENSTPLDKTTELSLQDYIRLAIQKSFSAQQYQQRTQAQILALKLAEKSFIPTFNLTTQYGQEEKNLYLSQPLDNQNIGFDSSITANWHIPTGANISISVQQQHGALEGLTSLGVPDIRQTNTYSTLSIDQPIFGGLWDNLSHLPQARAQYQWQLFVQEGQLLTINTIRNALLGYLDFQVQVETVKLLQTALDYANFRTDATNERYQEGQIAYSELLNAQLERHQRHAALTKAQNEIKLIQARLGALLDIPSSLLFKPLVSADVLLSCTQLDIDQQSGLLPHAILQHPELTSAKLNHRIAHTQYQAQKYTLWPQVSLFYEQSYNSLALQQNARTESFGIKATYTPLNTNGELSLAQQRSIWVNAGYDYNAKHKQLIKDWQIYTANHRILEEQLNLADQGMHLAHKAFDHAKERFKYGVSSILDVKQAQNELLDAQQNRLNGLKSLIENQLTLHFSAGLATPVSDCY